MEDEEDDVSERLSNRISKSVNPKFNDRNVKNSAKYFLDWVSEHKIFTIFILLLVIFGFDKVARYLSDRY